jgi:hypothetical protein
VRAKPDQSIAEPRINPINPITTHPPAMVLELHIWGPAFSLPSIDPHCLAAIAYLQQAVPPGEWQLVASSNPTLSPTSTFDRPHCERH